MFVCLFVCRLFIRLRSLVFTARCATVSCVFPRLQSLACFQAYRFILCMCCVLDLDVDVDVDMDMDMYMDVDVYVFA